MKLESLVVDRFGPWNHGVQLSLDPGITVLYGANETGKSTLRDFIYGMLFGFGPGVPQGSGARCAEFAGRAVFTAGGTRWVLQRRTADGQESAQLATDAGAPLPLSRLREGLGPLDAATYRQVCCVSLEDLQEFHALQSADIARRLFELSTGLDRAVLAQGMRELDARRRALLGAQPEDASRIAALLQQRDQLCTAIEQQLVRRQGYRDLCRQQRDCQRDIAHRDAEGRQLQQTLDTIDAALRLAPRWQHRAELLAQLEALPDEPELAESLLRRWQRLQRRLGRCRRRLRSVLRARDDVRREAQQIPCTPGLLGYVPRIESLASQHEYLADLEHRIRETQLRLAHGAPVLPQPDGTASTHVPPTARGDAAPLASRRAVSPGALPGALPSTSPDASPGSSRGTSHATRRGTSHGTSPPSSPATVPGALPDDVAAAADPAAGLRSLAQRVQRWHKRLLAARRILQAAQSQAGDAHAPRGQTASSPTTSPPSAGSQAPSPDSARASHSEPPSPGGAASPAAELIAAQSEVALLRQAIEAHQRREQLHRQAMEIDQLATSLLDRPLMPLWALAALGGLFVGGVLLVLLGLFVPGSILGPLGGILVLLGLAGVGTSAATKYLYERSHQRQIDACYRQLEELRPQIGEAQRACEALDRQIPPHGGPLVVRLQQAEQRLAIAQRATAPRPAQPRPPAAPQGDLARAQRRVRLAEKRWRQARRAYQHAAAQARARRAAIAASAPPSVPGDPAPAPLPHDAALVAAARAQHQRYLDELLLQRDALREQVLHLAAELGWQLPSDSPLAELHALRGRLRQELAAHRMRDLLDRRAERLHRHARRLHRRLRRLRRLGRRLLAQLGAADAATLHQKVQRQRTRQQLLQQCADVERQMQAALGPLPWDAVRRCLESSTEPQLLHQRDQLQQQLREHATRLQEAHQRLGQVAAQLDAEAQDRSLAEQQLALATVEQQLRDALHAWQALAAACCAVDQLRRRYERHRQPAALAAASEYFARLTLGRYQRIWATIDQPRLMVDCAADAPTAGQPTTVPLDQLSRATRQQLCLALRLALLDALWEQGVRVPLVLDDVLANCDDQRAQAAVQLLCQYAEQGRQIVVMTCHRHVAALFRQAGVAVQTMPRPQAPRVPQQTQPPRPAALSIAVASIDRPVQCESAPDVPPAASTPPMHDLPSAAAGAAHPSIRTPFSAAPRPAAHDQRPQPAQRAFDAEEFAGELQDRSFSEPAPLLPYDAPQPARPADSKHAEAA